MNRWRHRGAAPRRKGVDRVRALYHYPGATIVHRRRSCAHSRCRHAKTSGGRRLCRLVVVGRPADRPVHSDHRVGNRRGDARQRRADTADSRSSGADVRRRSAAQWSKSGRSRCCTVITAQVRAPARGRRGSSCRQINSTRASSFTRRPFCPTSRHSRGSAAPACWWIAHPDAPWPVRHSTASRR